MSNGGKERGFAGLERLVSDVDGFLASIRNTSSGETARSIDAPGKSEQSRTRTYRTPQVAGGDSNITTTSRQKNKGVGIWLVGFGVVGLIVWILAQENSQRPPDVTKLTSTPSFEETEPASTTGLDDITVKSNDNSLNYSKPPPGTDNVLSVPQLRWCQRQAIRIDATRNVLESNIQVERFNRIVDDFNDRCGSFRYREGDLEKATREVLTVKDQIEFRAVIEFLSETSATGGSVENDNESVPKRTDAQSVEKVQQMLKELGYKPGPIDGIYGAGTKSAIQEFQYDAGLEVDGNVSKELLEALEIRLRGKGSSTGDRSDAGGARIGQEFKR